MRTKRNLNLTPKQMQVVRYLITYRDRHGLSPTLAEIADYLDVSKITVYEHVSQLVRKGALNKKRYLSRSLTVHPSLAEELRGRMAKENTSPARASEGIPAAKHGLPLLGRIAAGQPIEAVEDRSETLAIDEIVGFERANYALRVRGDSMIDEGIRDGDYVLIEKRSWASDGETVVAILDDEDVTLKRFFREKDRIRLQPANEAMEPIWVDSCEIRGVVVGVLRSY